jgi:hypothetical protein
MKAQEVTLVDALIVNISSEEEAISIAQKILSSKGIPLSSVMAPQPLPKRLEDSLGKEVYLEGNPGLLERGKHKDNFMVNFIHSGVFEFQAKDVSSFDGTTIKLKDINVVGGVG